MAKPWVPHVVQQGDHIRKLAFRLGVDADTLWKHEKNQALTKRRKNMDMLYPGDVLHIPAEPAPALDITPGTMNRYRAKVPGIHVELHLESSRRSLANQPFEVHGVSDGGEPIRGTTTATGAAVFDVPVLVREVQVHLPTVGFVMPVRVGDLDPIDELSGVTQRLRNLGFLPASGDVEQEAIDTALRAFQRQAGLPESAGLDDATRGALERQHIL